MLRPRIIPCLLVHQGGLVKTQAFNDPKYVGDPINAVRIFNEKEADELMVLRPREVLVPSDLGLLDKGVIIEENSVISMGVYISQSTKIYNRMTGEVSYGRVPAGSVVVSGSLPAVDGSHSLYCAVIVKRVTAETRAKTSINDLLRP